MTLKEYAEKINAMLKEYPDTAEYLVVTSIDDEGNGYNRVSYDPSIGNYDTEEREFDSHGEHNAVCVN